jgi:hypothetical protein
MVGMNDEQQKALDLYLESATIENDYKPLTYQQLSDELKKVGITKGKSTLQRWGATFEFEKRLENKLQTIMIDEDDKTPEQKALSKAYKKDAVTVERNSDLMAMSYEVLELIVEETLEDARNGKHIGKDRANFVKDVANLTAGREDKLLDRLANAGGDTLSSDELKEEFEMIDVEIEDE